MTTVLIVDDDHDIRATLRMFLEDTNFAAEEAEDGVAALAALRATAERWVVLVDRMMPRLDGISMLRAATADADLAERHAYLYMTARHDPPPRDDAQMLARWHIPIIAKPFQLDELEAAIKRAASRLHTTDL